MSSPIDTVAALALDSTRLVSLIGGGGKTTLMAALASDLVARGRRVIVTTTTRIRHPHVGTVIVEPSPGRLENRLRDELRAGSSVTLAREQLDDEKLKGLESTEVDHLVDLHLADTVLVEADGAAGRPLKAHAAHEPVIPHATEAVIAVIGVDCLGQPIDDRTVHRADRFASLLGLAPFEIISPEIVAAIVTHPLGYLREVPPGARVALMLNKADTPRTEAEALACAHTVRRADRADRSRLERIVIGSLRGHRPFVLVVK